MKRICTSGECSYPGTFTDSCPRCGQPGTELPEDPAESKELRQAEPVE